ncbi:MAG: CBS domain-containing protein [Thermoguttaceae bacterium]
MTLEDILSVKGRTVHSISGEATLQDVVARLMEHRIGSLVVVETDASGHDELVGIITDRDILYATMAGKPPLSDVKVAAVMSTGLVTAAPEDEVEDAMGVMTDRRIRHLPVLREGRLAGIISIGDVVKAQHDRLALENRCLKDYIAG